MALLPVVGDENGPFSHLYIVCINGDEISSTKRMVSDVKDITTQELLEESMIVDNPKYYIAAVVNENQYKEADVYRMGYNLGAEDRTTDSYDHEFRNRKLKVNLKYFFRVFSISSTPEV